MLFSVSCETLQIDLGGFEALSRCRVLIMISILLAREIFQQDVESHNICTPAVLVDVPLVPLMPQRWRPLLSFLLSTVQVN